MSIVHREVIQGRPELGEYPRPGAAALPYVVVAPVGPVLAAAGLAAWRFALALAAASLVAAGIRACWENVRLTRVRAEADRWLIQHRGHWPSSPLIALRQRELVSPHERRSLARSLERLVHDAVSGRLPGASPANLAAAAAEADVLLRLSGRLADLDRPVSARGVALSLDLLTNGDGPLYDRRRSSELGLAAERILRALEDVR